MNITPGYNFGATEVPKNATLALSVAGMSLTGIDISQIATTILGIKHGNTDTSLPDVGWMQRDDANGIWIKTEAEITASPGGEFDYGRVRLFRANWGGWESNRYKMENERDTFTYSAIDISRFRGILQPVPNNDTNPSNVFIRGKNGAGADTMSLKTMETGLTGLHTRVAGRGGSTEVGKWAWRYGFPDYVATYTGIGVTNANTQYFPAQNATQGVRNRGLALRQTGPIILYWAFGGAMATQ